MPISGKSVVIVGGTSGLGIAVAKFCVENGCQVVITGRDPERAKHIAATLGSLVTGIGFDLAQPESIAKALQDIGQVDHIVLAALERDKNTIEQYDTARAARLTTLKLVGYTEVVHALLPKLKRSVESSIVLFGGLSKESPYLGSMTITTVNAGLYGLMRSLALELSPIRVNSIHPSLVGDNHTWVNETDYVATVASKTLTKRITHTEDVVKAVDFLFDNLGVNAIELYVDGGLRAQPLM